MNERTQSKGWWKTVPGILTATAGIITAVTGLIVALYQAGIFDGEKQKVRQTIAHCVAGLGEGGAERPCSERARLGRVASRTHPDRTHPPANPKSECRRNAGHFREAY